MALPHINHGAWLLVTVRLTAVYIGAVAWPRAMAYTPGFTALALSNELDEGSCRSSSGAANR